MERGVGKVRKNCSVIGCTKPSLAKGLCNAHYLRKRKNKNIEKPIQQRNVFFTCKVEGCGKKHEGRGYCKNHLRRTLREEAWSIILKLKGDQCLRCGNKYHFSCYDLHHRDPSTKLFEVSQAITNVRFEELLEEIEKCDLICANCHRLLHYNEFK